MKIILLTKDFNGKRVKVLFSPKDHYKKYIGMFGDVVRISGSHIGVKIDNEINTGSHYGIFWFESNELKIATKEMEEEYMKLDGYDWVADVAVWDFKNKVYSYALFDKDKEVLNNLSYFDGMPQVVMVEDKNKAKYFGDLIDIKLRHEVDNDIPITAQVIGVVNMDRYNKEKYDAKCKEEMQKRAKQIRKELDAALERQKTMEFYKRFAADNPEFANLVSELEKIEGEI